MYHQNRYKGNTLLNHLFFLTILFALQITLIRQLFHLKYHLSLLFFSFGSLFYYHLHFHFHYLHLMALMFCHFHHYFHFHFHYLHYHHHHLLMILMFPHFHYYFYFHFCLFDFLILMSCQLKLHMINPWINLIILSDQGCVFYILLFLRFFISFDVFKLLLADISLIALLLILLTKSAISIYLNSPISCL